MSFSERFHELINEEVPRTLLRSYDEEMGRHEETFPVPEDGFVAHYCI